MTDLQLATQLNGGYRPMSFKRYEDGHMVIITHQGKKVTIAGEIVKKVGQSLKEKVSPPPPAACTRSLGVEDGRGVESERVPASNNKTDSAKPDTSPRIRGASARSVGNKRGGKSGSAKGK